MSDIAKRYALLREMSTTLGIEAYSINYYKLMGVLFLDRSEEEIDAIYKGRHGNDNTNVHVQSRANHENTAASF